MKSYLLPMILLAGCAVAPEPQPTQSQLYDGFVGQPFAWTHVSGVSGETVHYADGTMVYVSDGRERTADWTLSVEDRYCMNAGDYDQVCFILVPTPTGYASEDGTFRYERIAGDGYEAGPAPLDVMTPFEPAPDAPAMSGADGITGSIYDTPYSDRPLFGAAEDLPITSGPIE